MIETIAEFIVHTIVCVLLVSTGQAILFAVTFGRYRPDWHKYAERDVGLSVLAFEASFWIGAAFWFAVGFIAWWLLAA